MRDNATSAANQQGSPASAEPLRDYTPKISMNRHLAQLLGILYTDGCVSPKGKQSWRIYFLNASDTLIRLFQKNMMAVFGLPADRIRIKKRGGYIVAVVDAKDVGQSLIDQFGTFRTLAYSGNVETDAQLPVRSIMESGYTSDFLATAFSCDGGVSLYPAKRNGARGGTRWLIRTVFLACAHDRLRLDYLTLLHSLGISARNVHGDRKIKIETEDNIRRFAETVGFLPGVKVTRHSKFWNGHTKNDVLQRTVASYDRPASVYALPRFHRDYEIVRSS